MKNLFSVEGKVALVTGGSQGIGLMISSGLVENGATVYINSRKAAACEEAVRELSKHGTCHALPGDISTEAEIRRVLSEIEGREQKLHILVNNAGATWGAPLESYPEDAWNKVMNVNVRAVFYLCTVALPLLERSSSAEDPGRIVNIGSIEGLRVPEFDNFAYAASKAAVMHLTRILSIRLAPRHVTVNSIAPGPFPSKMMAATLAEIGDQLTAKAPLGRLGRPEDIAAATIYLSSPGSSWVTGQVLAVDGGFSNNPW